MSNDAGASSVVRNNRALSITNVDGTIDWGLELTAASTTAYTITERDVTSGANMEVYALALDLDDRGSKVGSVDGPSSGATWDPSVSLSFTPQYVGLGLTRCPTENSIEVGVDSGSEGISSNSGPGEETCHSWYNDDAATEMVTNTLFRSRAIDFRDQDVTTVVQDHSHSAFDSTGWTYTINSEGEAAATKWFYWAIEAIPTTDDKDPYWIADGQQQPVLEPDEVVGY